MIGGSAASSAISSLKGPKTRDIVAYEAKKSKPEITEDAYSASLEILGAGRSDTLKDIDSKKRKHILNNHPDKYPNASSEVK